MGAWNRASAVFVFAAVGFGGVLAGCGSGADTSGGSSATINLTSLPSAEVWVDGSARGSTPVALAVSPGRHDLVMRQTGFDDFRQSLEVTGTAPQTIDATLVAKDAENPDALRKIAAAFDVTVEPITTPSLHRGAGNPDVVLMFPRNDVRREGLATWRIDITPTYGGDGTLEWREGKTVLAKQSFNPATLVSVGEVPKNVLEAAKVGETVTWGVYFTDKRKPITAQFEVVSKPQAAKKLAELDADKRLAKQPLELREQLRAEVLQNYRLYSEALATYLDLRAKNKDSLLPHGGIVACLRRMDLEATALYAESASKVGGKFRGRNDGPGAAGGPLAPVANVPSSGPAAGSTTPGPGGAAPNAGATSSTPSTGSPTTSTETAPAAPGAPATPPTPDVPPNPAGPATAAGGDTPPTPATPPTGATPGNPAGAPPAPGDAGKPLVGPQNPADTLKANDPSRVAAAAQAASNAAAEAAKAATMQSEQAKQAANAARDAAAAAAKAAADHAGQADETDLAAAARAAAEEAKRASDAAAQADDNAKAAAAAAAKAAAEAARTAGDLKKVDPAGTGSKPAGDQPPQPDPKPPQDQPPAPVPPLDKPVGDQPPQPDPTPIPPVGDGK